MNKNLQMQSKPKISRTSRNLNLMTSSNLGGLSTSIQCRRDMNGISTIKLIMMLTIHHLRLCKGTNLLCSIQICLIKLQRHNSSQSNLTHQILLLLGSMLGPLMRILHSRSSIENGRCLRDTVSGMFSIKVCFIFISTSKSIGTEDET